MAYIFDHKEKLTGKYVCDIILDNLNCENTVRDEWSIQLPAGETVPAPKVSTQPFYFND